MWSTTDFERIVQEIHMKYYNRGFFNKEKEEIKEICQVTGRDKKEVKKAIEEIKNPVSINERIQTKRNSRGIRRYANALDGSYMSNHPEEQTHIQPKVVDRSAHCPRCKSTSIAYGGKRLSLGRTLVGYGLAGETGAILGGLTGKKGYAKCLNCGKTWKI